MQLDFNTELFSGGNWYIVCCMLTGRRNEIHLKLLLNPNLSPALLMLQTFNPSTVEAEARRSFDKASRTGESSEPELHSKTPSQNKTHSSQNQKPTFGFWLLLQKVGKYLLSMQEDTCIPQVSTPQVHIKLNIMAHVCIPYVSMWGQEAETEESLTFLLQKASYTQQKQQTLLKQG